MSRRIACDKAPGPGTLTPRPSFSFFFSYQQRNYSTQKLLKYEPDRASTQAIRGTANKPLG